MNTPAVRAFPALKALAALALLAALTLLLYAAIPFPAGATSHWEDYDSDNDGLIDIKTVAQLQGIRYDHNGDGALRADLITGSDGNNYRAAFPDGNVVAHTTATSTPRMGCPAACRGYELMNDLDFAGAGWSTGYPYEGIFEGNGYTISNMTQTVPAGQTTGLFGNLYASGTVRNVGLINAVITSSSQSAGILAGTNRGTISASFVDGGSIAFNGSANPTIGGLVGTNDQGGTITAAYSTATVDAGSHDNGRAGGLVGELNVGTVTDSFAAGHVTGTEVVGVSGIVLDFGGLVGEIRASNTSTSIITDSYCAVDGQPTACIGATNGATSTVEVKTETELQTPTDNTGIYADWDAAVWDFRTAGEYPVPASYVQSRVGHDPDGDNLINVDSLQKLNAIRHDLDGDGRTDATGTAALSGYYGAFRNTDLLGASSTRMRCADACMGYELTANLDFDTDGDGQVGVSATSTDPYPNWVPIGTTAAPYAAEFNGNGYTISRLTTSGTSAAGLFGALTTGGVIREVGIITPDVSGLDYAGGLVGYVYNGSSTEITGSYVSGGTVEIVGPLSGTEGAAGGLVGRINAPTGATIVRSYIELRAVYSTAAVDAMINTADIDVGGLVGRSRFASYAASYAAGSATATNAGANVGGFIGEIQGALADAAINSYCDNTTSTQCIGNVAFASGGISATATIPATSTAALQSPTGYTGIYSRWRVDVDGDDFPDRAWNFGTSGEYPTLRSARERGMDTATSYDADGDNLIEIATAEQLAVVRYDLDGDGLPADVGDYVDYAAAFPAGDLAATGTRMGCASGCEGYELTAAITLSGDWTPIDGGTAGYVAEFDGGGYTISGLMVTGGTNAGLFGRLGDAAGSGGVIRDLGLMSPNVSGNIYVGGLVGYAFAGTEITTSYVQGGTSTVANLGGYAGGLVGFNLGEIKAAYARGGSVIASSPTGSNAGGLTGNNGDTGHIIASYAAATVSGAANIGGLAGQVWTATSRITDSYCDTTVGTSTCIGNHGGTPPATATAAGHSSAHLKTPTGYTGIYATWNLDLDGDTFPDYLWDFGTATEYPGLNTPAERRAAAAMVVDYDADDDNLIDIRNIHQLNALRYDRDGNGRPDNDADYSAYSGGFPNGNIADTSTTMGCAAACIGYELLADIDSAADAYPDWTPIPPYGATLDGKGYYIAGLAVSGDDANAGLFAELTGEAVIRDLGLKTASVSSSADNAKVGALVGDNAGLITASYVDGGSVTVSGATSSVGGLAGRNTGDLRAVYATASVTASTTATSTAGGLIGEHSGSGGSIIASYAAGRVTGPNAVVGGLIGDASAAVEASYCDTTVSTQDDCIGMATGGAAAEGKTTAELQSPTGYTGIYQAWGISLIPGEDVLYAPWDFGEATDYPTLYGPAERQPFQTDTLPPPLPRSIPPEPEKPYDPAADHPEIYANAEYEMAATCQTYNGDPETRNPLAATITFDLGSYTGPVLLHLSIWTNGRYMAYETQGLAQPTLERDGQRATLRVATDPTQTRFRLDGRRHGLATNLLLGYANCHDDES